MRIFAEKLIDDAFRVESQQALVFLTYLHALVAVQYGFYVTAQVCVVVPTFEVDVL